MDRIGISDLKWRKSRYSNGQANCVEVALLADGGRAVRDSKDSHGPVLRFTANEWKAFIGRIKSDR